MITACLSCAKWRRNYRKIRCTLKSRTTTQLSLPNREWDEQYIDYLLLNKQKSDHLLWVHLARSPDAEPVRTHSCIAMKLMRLIVRRRCTNSEPTLPNCRRSVLLLAGMVFDWNWIESNLSNLLETWNDEGRCWITHFRIIFGPIHTMNK